MQGVETGWLEAKPGLLWKEEQEQIVGLGETFPSNRHSAKYTSNCASQGGLTSPLEQNLSLLEKWKLQSFNRSSGSSVGSRIYLPALRRAIKWGWEVWFILELVTINPLETAELLVEQEGGMCLFAALSLGWCHHHLIFSTAKVWWQKKKKILELKS